MPTFTVAVIGAGVVGLATAKALVERGVRNLVVVEAEPHVAAHQTGHNSGVIHSGIYYKPGSAKATNCAAGRELLYRFCADHGLPHDRCGKVIVAVEPRELPALAEIERRGHANGLSGLKRLTAAELKEHEPHVAGVAGLFVPQTGIVNYRAVASKYAELVTSGGGEVRTGERFVGLNRDGVGLVLRTTAGELRASHLVNCAGLQADRVARLCGVEPGVTIIPFRGEYYDLKPHAQHLCRNLIYPVPDPRFPFLGVHFTRMIGGGVEAGPNAVLAFRREGYRFSDVCAKDVMEMARFPGFWVMAAKFWRTGLMEMRRSLSAYSFWKSLHRLIPAIRRDDITPGGAGVRAQALTPDGKLVDDFVFRGDSRMVHVLNAPSPAATASLSVGRSVAELACREWGLT